MAAVGQVIGVRWYPVKSMQGEELAGSLFTALGIPGDRHWGVADATSGVVLSAKREPRLLEASASVAYGEAEITLPDGTTVTSDDPKVDDLLSTWLDRDVRLVAATPDVQGTYEIGADFEDDAHPQVFRWEGPPGAFFDSRPVHIISTASLAAVGAEHRGGAFDVRRFRPNLIVDVDGEGFVEDAWVGAILRVGAATLEVVKPTDRCVMTTRPQAGLPRDLDILKTINRVHGGNLGVHTRVVRDGYAQVGDAIELVDG